MGMHLEILNLLPKTNCQKCGRNNCMVFASEVAQRQACVEACPDITDEAERALHRLICAENEVISWLGGMITDVSKFQIRSALRLLKEVFILFPIRLEFALLFTFPITFPFVMIVLWLYNR